jgi:hypothetical protein
MHRRLSNGRGVSAGWRMRFPGQGAEKMVLPRQAGSRFAAERLEGRMLLDAAVAEVGSPLQTSGGNMEYDPSTPVVATAGEKITIDVEVSSLVSYDGMQSPTPAPTGSVAVIDQNGATQATVSLSTTGFLSNGAPFSSGTGQLTVGNATETLYASYPGDSIYTSKVYPLQYLVIDVAPAQTRLEFLQQPQNAAVGDTLAPPVTVQLLNNDGTNDTTGTNAITLSIAASGSSAATATLGGTTTEGAVGGLATFRNLTVDTPGSYYLTASAAGLTSVVSQSFTVSAGKLVFLASPRSGSAREALAPAVKVALENATGQTLTEDSSTVVTLSPVGLLAGSPISGNTATLEDGVATFSNVVLSKAGFYQLQATDGADAEATTGKFKVAGDKLVFARPPAAGDINAPIALSVEIENTQGQRVTDSTSSVVLSLNVVSGGKNAALAATTTVAFVGGIATFTTTAGPTINVSGTYTLTATEEDTSLGALAPTNTTVPITTRPFAIAGYHLVVKTPPAQSDVLAAIPLAIEVVDSKGKLDTSEAAAQVQLSLETVSGGTGAQLQGTTVATFSGGVAAFTADAGPQITAEGTYKLTAVEIGASELAADVSTQPFKVLGYHLSNAQHIQNLYPHPATSDLLQPSTNVRVTLYDARDNQVTSLAGLPNVQASYSLKGTTASTSGTVTATPVLQYNSVYYLFPINFLVAGTYTLNYAAVRTDGAVIPPSAITGSSQDVIVSPPVLKVGRVGSVAANQEFEVAAELVQPNSQNTLFLGEGLVPNVGFSVKINGAAAAQQVLAGATAASANGGRALAAITPITIASPGIYHLTVSEVITQTGSNFDPGNFTSAGDALDASVTVRVTPDKLVFLQEPPKKILSGQPFTVSVAFEDQQGNILTDISNVISGDDLLTQSMLPVAILSLSTLSGKQAPDFESLAPVQFQAGVATFSNLVINTQDVFTIHATQKEMSLLDNSLVPSLIASITGTSIAFTVD